MYAIEFQTTVKNGLIEVPRQYIGNLTNRVHVILMAEETSKAAVNLVDQLLAHPVPMKDFRPFAREDIYARQSNHDLLH